ncbi:hypothetical protein GPJ56_004648 [Histomonas meleagridis]|uniref:uncharacterized protein n=1 Tax=Histomonas meleagridis TaxID=135588 RepID=UPI0035599CC9|nr:hypothetical protein GPJ56_004648 [Histomonas meleagridis]KAH0797410.1 hypothetical protein GO595_009731 [Histomonas meleagridis]
MSDSSYDSSDKEQEGEEANTEQTEDEEDDKKTVPLPSLLVDVIPDPRDTEEDVLLPYFTKKVAKKVSAINTKKNKKDTKSK